MGRASGQQQAVAAPARRGAATGAPVSGRAEAHDPDAFEAARAVRAVLHDREFVHAEKLLEPEYRDDPNPYAGHCYAASEALYHLLGASASGFQPRRVKLKQRTAGLPKGTRHWWLVDQNGKRLDITGEQFPNGFPYELGVNGGFLTGDRPSKRAQKILDRVLADNPQLRS